MASTLEAGQIRVSPEELSEAHRTADPAYLETIARVRDNILAYQKAILHRDVIDQAGPGIELGFSIGRCAGWACAFRAAPRRTRRAC